VKTIKLKHEVLLIETGMVFLFLIVINLSDFYLI
jgi:hypothetical protein